MTLTPRNPGPMPANTTKPDLILADKAPVQCVLHVASDPPYFWSRCQTNATDKLTVAECGKVARWLEIHPLAIIMVPKVGLGHVYVCETHYETIKEIISE